MSNVAIQTMLICLSFKHDAAKYFVNNEGLNSIERISCLNDHEMINLMCKSCRKGHINEPPVQATCNAAANWASWDGHAIGVIQNNILKNAVFYVKYKDMTSRPSEPEEIMLKTLEPVSNFKKPFNGMKNPAIDEASKLIHKQTIKFFDKCKVFLNENLGSASKRPLGHVAQKLVLVKESEAFGEPDSPFCKLL